MTPSSRVQSRFPSISAARAPPWSRPPTVGPGRASASSIWRPARTGRSTTGPASAFEPVQRFTKSLIKLVPTEWGPPTFEIDGIKMLPTAQVSPYADAERKVGLIQPRGKAILDTCGGLGYFAAWCLQGGASRVQSYEKNADVIWLRSLNPWSPAGRRRVDADPRRHRRRDRARCPPARSTRSCTTRRASASPASSTRRPSTTSWRECSSARASCSTTPARRTSSPAAATSPTKSPSGCGNAGFTTKLNGDGVLAVRKCELLRGRTTPGSGLNR